MSLFKDLPKDVQLHIKNSTIFNFLEKLGFEPRSKIEEDFRNEFDNFQSPTLEFLCIRYHGMGHYQVVTLDPTRADKEFYLSVVGGSDDITRRENINNLYHRKEQNFCNLSDLLKYAYATSYSSVYIDLNDALKMVDLDDFTAFIFSCIPA